MCVCMWFYMYEYNSPKKLEDNIASPGAVLKATQNSISSQVLNQFYHLENFLNVLSIIPEEGVCSNNIDNILVLLILEVWSNKAIYLVFEQNCFIHEHVFLFLHVYSEYSLYTFQIN